MKTAWYLVIPLVLPVGFPSVVAEEVNYWEDDADAGLSVDLTEQEREIQRMEELAQALPELHEVKRSGKWEYMDEISKFELTFRSAASAWKAVIRDELAQVSDDDLIERAVDALNEVIHRWELEFDSILRFPVSVLEQHALHLQSRSKRWELVTDAIVKKLSKFESLEKAVPGYLECTQGAKSRAYKKSLGTNSFFLKTLEESLDGITSAKDAVEVVSSESKHYGTRLVDYGTAFGDDSLLCLKDLDPFYVAAINKAENQQ